MPAGAVEHHDSMTARLDVALDLGQVQVHCFGIGLREHETGTDTVRRADGAEHAPASHGNGVSAAFAIA